MAKTPRNQAQNAAAAGYSGTPLSKKLGVKPGTTLALLGAPKDFEATLGELPEGAAVRRAARKPCERVLLFVSSQRELEGGFSAAAQLVADGGTLWLAWPKKSSGRATDLSETAVREFGLARSWVDYKVCAIDFTWSGHAFARRK